MGFALTLKGVSKEERASKVLAAAKLLDLEKYLDRKPKALSGGQRQRVAMGRAIVREPSVFLMDEPLSNLDAKLRVETRANIAALQARLGTTTIYVTHDQVEAMTMGDRVALLKDGILQQVDTPRNLYDSPGNAFVAGFIGSPAMNLVKVPFNGNSGTLGGMEIAIKPDAAAAARSAGLKEIILGIRPESFHASENGHGLKLKATLVEELGADAFVYGELPGTKTHDVGDDGGAKPFTVRFDGRVPPKIGNEISLDVRTDETHAFNPETGERLGA
jgi:multiple sugar transport system ATP-binding protein